MVRVHDEAALRLVRAILPGMVARGRGGIVLVSSIGAFTPGPGNATYCATKAFLNLFAESVQAELDGSGVRVQALCPGFTRTEFHDSAELARFDRAAIPGPLWMSADAVAAESLAALRRGRGVVYVPGRRNRALVTALRAARCPPRCGGPQPASSWAAARRPAARGEAGRQRAARKRD